MGKSRAAHIAAMFRVEHAPAPGKPVAAPVPPTAPEGPDTYEAEKPAARQEYARRNAKRLAINVKRARVAARKLEEGSASDLDLDLLLCELTVDAQIKWITFVVTDGGWAKHFTFARMRLRRIAQERPRNGRLTDLRGWIDAKGLHLRWGNRGGFDLRGESDPVMDSRTLRVSFLVSERESTDEADCQRRDVA